MLFNLIIFQFFYNPPYLPLKERHTAFDCPNYRIVVQVPLTTSPSAPHYSGPGGWALSHLNPSVIFCSYFYGLRHQLLQGPEQLRPEQPPEHSLPDRSHDVQEHHLW